MLRTINAYAPKEQPISLINCMITMLQATMKQKGLNFIIGVATASVAVSAILAIFWLSVGAAHAASLAGYSLDV